jgi:hypothetical protein
MLDAIKLETDLLEIRSNFIYVYYFLQYIILNIYIFIYIELVKLSDSSLK